MDMREPVLVAVSEHSFVLVLVACIRYGGKEREGKEKDGVGNGVDTGAGTGARGDC